MYRCLLLCLILTIRSATPQSYCWRCDNSSLCVGNITDLGSSFRDEDSSTTFPQIIALEIDTCNITNLPKNFSMRMPNLTELIVKNCSNFAVVDSDVFGGAKDRVWSNLTSLTINKCSVKSIEDETFKGALRLLEVDLSMNQLTKLSPQAFAGLTELTNLDLSKNQLQDLPNGIFNETTNIFYLNLIGNKLKAVDFAMFDTMPKCRDAYFSHNNISNVKVDKLDTQIERLFLSHNQLEDVAPLQNLDGLKTLFLSYNPKLKLLSSAFQGWSKLLNKLALNGCGLSNITRILSTMNALTTLDLSENNLKTVNFSEFPTMPALKALFLNANNLTNILNEANILTEKFPVLQWLYVSDNTRNCEEIRHFVQGAKNLSNLTVITECLKHVSFEMTPPPPRPHDYHWFLIVVLIGGIIGLSAAFRVIHSKMKYKHKVEVEYTRYYDEFPNQSLFYMIPREPVTPGRRTFY